LKIRPKIRPNTSYVRTKFDEMSDEISVGLSDENSAGSHQKSLCMNVPREARAKWGYMRVGELECEGQCMTARVKEMMGESGAAKRDTALGLSANEDRPFISALKSLWQTAACQALHFHSFPGCQPPCPPYLNVMNTTLY
jgi:hypothetical protein